MTSKKTLPKETEEFLGSFVGKAPTTKKLYRIVLTSLFEYTKKDPKLLQVYEIQSFLKNLEERNYKKNTLRVYINVIRNFLKYLKQMTLHF